MHRIIADRETEVHRQHSPIIGGMAIPFSIETDDDVATVPQSGTEVDLLTVVTVGVGARLLLRKPERGGVHPVSNRRMHELTDADSMTATLSSEVVASVQFRPAGHLKPT